MKVRDFCVEITKLEKGKKEVNIAQTMEIVKIVRQLLDEAVYLDIYQIIHSMKRGGR